MPLKSIIFASCVLFGTYAHALRVTQTNPNSLGVDITMPYIVTVDGDSYNRKDAMDLGLRYLRFINNNVGFGLRFSYDFQDKPGQEQQWIAAPGVMYQWFQGKTWMPFIRFDLPIVLYGAFNNDNKSSQKDLGVITGFGLAWNLGNQMGIDNLLIRYDFNAQYYFGFGQAINNFGIEFFRFGIDYRF